MKGNLTAIASSLSQEQIKMMLEQTKKLSGENRAMLDNYVLAYSNDPYVCRRLGVDYATLPDKDVEKLTAVIYIDMFGWPGTITSTEPRAEVRETATQ